MLGLWSRSALMAGFQALEALLPGFSPNLDALPADK